MQAFWLKGTGFAPSINVCRGGDGKRSKYHLVGTRSLEARDHLHRSGLLLFLASLRSNRVSRRVVLASGRQGGRWGPHRGVVSVLAALGDASGPEVAMLQSSLQSANELHRSQLWMSRSASSSFPGLKRGWWHTTRSGLVWSQSCRKARVASQDCERLQGCAHSATSSTRTREHKLLVWRRW